MSAGSLTTAAPGARRIVVDADHFAVRFLVPVLALVGAIIFHVLASVLLAGWLEDHGTTPFCLIAPGDVLAFVAGAYVTERVLKRLLPSRRYATLSAEALALVDGRGKETITTTLNWRSMVNVQGWRFEVTRRARVPKGWFCLALYLLQDEQDVIFYSFMDGNEAEHLRGYEHFYRLRPRKEIKNTTDLTTAAQQSRLLNLENQRWQDGAEISPDDFRALLGALMSSVHEWA